MRLRWRKTDAETLSDTDSLDRAESSHQEALAQLEESLIARGKVEEQKEHGVTIAQMLAEIRAKNHFQEIWNDGLRGG